jgi:hypothetical protein
MSKLSEYGHKYFAFFLIIIIIISCYIKAFILSSKKYYDSGVCYGKWESPSGCDIENNCVGLSVKDARNQTKQKVQKYTIPDESNFENCPIPEGSEITVDCTQKEDGEAALCDIDCDAYFLYADDDKACENVTCEDGNFKNNNIIVYDTYHIRTKPQGKKGKKCLHPHKHQIERVVNCCNKTL